MFRNQLGLTLVAAFLLCGPATIGAPYFADSAPGGISPGSGSAIDPFRIASPTDFQGILDRLPAGAKLHLAPGVYPIGRGLLLRKSLELRSAGGERATLRIASALPSKTTAAAIFGHYPDDNSNEYVIENLIIDANWRGQTEENVATVAIGGFGAKLTVRDVEIYNCGNNQAGEAFYLAAFSQRANRPMFATIENVHFHGDGGEGTSTAIHIGGQGDGSVTGTVTNCLVERNARGVGVGLSSSKEGVVVSHNIVRFNPSARNGVGILHDTWDSKNSRIEDNHITTARHGLGILIGGGANYRNYVVARNRINVLSRANGIRIGPNVEDAIIVANQFLRGSPFVRNRIAVECVGEGSMIALIANRFDPSGFNQLIGGENAAESVQASFMNLPVLD